MFGGKFNDWTSDSARSVVSALERTGEAITKSATQAAQSSQQSQSEQDTETKDQQKEDASQAKRQEMLGKLRGSWSSVMVATKNAIEHTREVVEKEQTKLFSPRGAYKRDPKLPLDVDALRDAEVVYVTDRLITMSHPAMQSNVDGDITPDRKLAAVGHLLQRRHGGRYMVWNLSEVEYDVDILDDQVLTFQFPGSPSPPLGCLLKLLISMESWLKADDRNVAVVHCLTGRGRTSTVVAAFLCWTGEAGFHDVNSALEYVANCKHVSIEELTIPSQRRYVSYFANMLDGVRPSQPPLMLKRIIMSEAPKFGKGPVKAGSAHLSPTDDEGVEEDRSRMGCAPYLQIFKAGHLVFTTAATLSYNQPKDELPFCTVADGAISFHAEQVVQGDILIRCRHLTKSGQRVSMFRAAFHTGYVPPSVLRLTKAQLDGACDDKRFSDDFFLDLIFEPCDAEVASKHLTEGKSEQEGESEKAENGQSDSEKPEPTPQGAQNNGGGMTVSASEYDSMLHRDSRFWDVIAARRQQQASKNVNDNQDETWGPTIGRRRAWDSTPGKKSKSKSDSKDRKGKGSSKKGSAASKPSALDAFSIGEFDFLPEEMDDAAEQTPVEKEEPAPPPKQRDELMEALMAIDDEALSPDPVSKGTVQVETEEIVFKKDSDEDGSLEAKPTMVALPPLVDKTSEVPSTETGMESKEKEEVPAKEEAVEKEGATEEKKPVKKDETVEKKPENVTDVAASLLADADLDVDADVDAFLASTQDEDGAADVENIDDLLDFDDDDVDLEDLENFLTQTGK